MLMINRNGLFLSLMLIGCFSTQISAMETDTPKDPSINTDGVCHLARLPTEIRNNIAKYLTLLHYETPDEFLNRCELMVKKMFRTGEPTKTPFGHIYKNFLEISLYDQEDKKKKTIYSARGNTLLEKLQYNFSRFLGITKNFSLLHGRISPSGHSVAITETVYDYDSSPNGYRSNDAPTHCKNIHLVQLADQTKETIDTSNLPHDVYTLPVNISPAILTHLASLGYDTFRNYNGYKSENWLNQLAISFDNKKIAIANNIQIFLAQKDEQGKWGVFQLIKTLDFTIKEIEDRSYPSKDIYYIAFNKQGTALWVNFNDDNRPHKESDYSEIVPIESEKRENLLELYFRENLICKKISNNNA